jgi:hypothetical protein
VRPRSVAARQGAVRGGRLRLDPADLIESELFGHERGAFTGATASYAGAFERAHGGTVFLDELGELPLAMQPKLLRVLEAKEVRRVGGQKTITVDIRIVAATNRDLGVEVNRGRFREDLFYRLAVARVVVPPLRERKEDIPLLIEGILATTPGGEGAYIAAETIDLMMKHDWPGNVRELRNVIERAVLLAEPPESAAQLRRAPIPQPPPRPITDAVDHRVVARRHDDRAGRHRDAVQGGQAATSSPSSSAATSRSSWPTTTATSRPRRAPPASIACRSTRCCTASAWPTPAATTARRRSTSAIRPRIDRGHAGRRRRSVPHREPRRTRRPWPGWPPPPRRPRRSTRSTRSTDTDASASRVGDRTAGRLPDDASATSARWRWRGVVCWARCRSVAVAIGGGTIVAGHLLLAVGRARWRRRTQAALAWTTALPFPLAGVRGFFAATVPMIDVTFATPPDLDDFAAGIRGHTGGARVLAIDAATRTASSCPVRGREAPPADAAWLQAVRQRGAGAAARGAGHRRGPARRARPGAGRIRGSRAAAQRVERHPTRPHVSLATSASATATAARRTTPPPRVSTSWAPRSAPTNCPAAIGNDTDQAIAPWRAEPRHRRQVGREVHDLGVGAGAVGGLAEQPQEADDQSVPVPGPKKPS